MKLQNSGWAKCGIWLSEDGTDQLVTGSWILCLQTRTCLAILIPCLRRDDLLSVLDLSPLTNVKFSVKDDQKLVWKTANIKFFITQNIIAWRSACWSVSVDAASVRLLYMHWKHCDQLYEISCGIENANWRNTSLGMNAIENQDWKVQSTLGKLRPRCRFVDDLIWELILSAMVANVVDETQLTRSESPNDLGVMAESDWVSVSRFFVEWKAVRRC